MTGAPSIKFKDPKYENQRFISIFFSPQHAPLLLNKHLRHEKHPSFRSSACFIFQKAQLLMINHELCRISLFLVLNLS